MSTALFLRVRTRGALYERTNLDLYQYNPNNSLKTKHNSNIIITNITKQEICQKNNIRNK